MLGVEIGVRDTAESIPGVYFGHFSIVFALKRAIPIFSGITVTPRCRKLKICILPNIGMLGVKIGVFDTTESIPGVYFGHFSRVFALTRTTPI